MTFSVFRYSRCILKLHHIRSKTTLLHPRWNKDADSSFQQRVLFFDITAVISVGFMFFPSTVHGDFVFKPWIQTVNACHLLHSPFWMIFCYSAVWKVSLGDQTKMIKPVINYGNDCCVAKLKRRIGKSPENLWPVKWTSVLPTVTEVSIWCLYTSCLRWDGKSATQTHSSCSELSSKLSWCVS